LSPRKQAKYRRQLEESRPKQVHHSLEDMNRALAVMAILAVGAIVAFAPMYYFAGNH
jgi:hypothetical protein